MRLRHNKCLPTLMNPTVVLIGTLDTKGVEFDFLRTCLRALGCDVILMDAGIIGIPLAQPDISREEVAAAANADVRVLAAAGDRGTAVNTMASGAAAITLHLHSENRVHGVLGMGGSGNSTIASSAMRALPTGVPKLLVSTLASGDTRPYIGESDIAMLYSVVDIAGINRVSERILSNAAAAMAGMATQELARSRAQAIVSNKKLIAATMFGVTTPCVSTARAWLEADGSEVLVFHATGTGGRAMEALVRGGFVDGVLDITTTELADELVGGALSAGPNRMEIAGALGLPQVVSLGALDMVNFGPIASVPEKFKDRRLHVHNASVTLMRTTPAESAELGAIIARKLNAAKGPVTLFIPLRGTSAISGEGGAFHDAVADLALFDSLRTHLHAQVRVVEMDTEINDPVFARAMARCMAGLIKATNET